MSAGSDHNLALRSDGQLVAWGSNAYGELEIPALPQGMVWLELSGGWAHSVGRYGLPCSAEALSYCTAKTNSQGCVPAITVTGTPNASAGVGCTLSTANLVANKLGLYLHGTSGAQSSPFHGGFLCVQVRSSAFRCRAQAALQRRAAVC